MERTEITGGYRLTAGIGKEMVGLVNGEEVARVPEITVVGNSAITWVEDYEKITEIWTPESGN